MAFEDIMKFFPVANMATNAVTSGIGSAIPGMSELGQGGLMGLLAPQFATQQQNQPDPYSPQQFLGSGSMASQTPGAPTQPGRIDQTSFQGQQMDPMALLEQNIMRRFGGQ